MVLAEIVVTGPPPFAVAETRKRLGKEAPVETVPLLVIVIVKVVGVPAVATTGLTVPGIRFGRPAAEVIKLELAEYPLPVALSA